MLKVFGVYDSKAQTYGQPYFSVNEGVALRMFQGVCKNPASNVHLYPEDYALHTIASYDETTGQFVNLKAPELLAMAIQYVELAKLEIQKLRAADLADANQEELSQ